MAAPCSHTSLAIIHPFRAPYPTFLWYNVLLRLALAATHALTPPRPLPFLAPSSGPAGLFAALSAASAGLPVVLLEKGQPVEQRGRDIGALFARGKLNPDSNLCYGKGVGAAGVRPAGREVEGGMKKIEAACR